MNLSEGEQRGLRLQAEQELPDRLKVNGPPLPVPLGSFGTLFATERLRQAARALALAMPFLSRAKVVTVLTAQEDENDPDLDGVISYLRSHGVKAEGRHLATDEGGAAAAVLTAAQNESLLVMGAYGHSRIGEWVFGGFTRTAIEQAVVPVLMAH